MSLPIRNHLVAFYLFVSVGRVHELIPQLQNLPFGKVSLLLALIGVTLSGRDARSILPRSGIINLLWMLLVLAVMSVFISVWKTQSIHEIKGTVLTLFFIVYFVHACCRQLEDVGYFINVLVAIAIVLSISALRVTGEDRVSVSNMYDPNDLALVIATILPLAMVKALSVRGSMRVFFIGISLLMIFAIILTGSRGGFIGMAGVIIYLLVSRMPDKEGQLRGRLSLSKIIVILVVSALVFVFSPPNYWNRVKSIFNPQQDYNVSSPRGRITLWKQGLDIIASRPYGVGIGAYPAAQGMLMGGYYQTVHNSLLLIGAELGVLGLLLYLLLFKYAFSYLTKLREITQKCDTIFVNQIIYLSLSLKAALVGFFLSSFFLSQSYSPVLYVLLVLVNGAYMILFQSQGKNNAIN